MTREEAINDVMSALNYLILSHASSTALEQYAPSRTPDESDDHIKEGKLWVEKLRDIREQFENLVTGY